MSDKSWGRCATGHVFQVAALPLEVSAWAAAVQAARCPDCGEPALYLIALDSHAELVMDLQEKPQ